MPKSPVRVAVTGAAGQIGYSLLFRIASGEMLGKDQPVILQMLEIPDEKAQKALKGVMMELDDCAFPLLHGMVPRPIRWSRSRTSRWRFVGARPRGPGMERKDLLEANGKIFGAARQGARSRGEPQREGPGGRQPGEHELPDRDEERARAEADAVHRNDAPRSQPRNFADLPQDLEAGDFLLGKITVGQPLGDAIPRHISGRMRRKKVWPMINDQAWLEQSFIPTVQKRGAAIIDARGLSSAASAANAAIDHVRDWISGSRGRRLGDDGRALRRQLRNSGRRDLRLPRHPPRRAVPGRQGHRGQRFQPQAHRRDAQGAARRAR